MINLFGYLVLIAFIIRTLRNAFYQTFLWQLKEYRVDRMIAHLKTPQGRKLIFGPITLIKWLIFILIIITYVKTQRDNVYWEISRLELLHITLHYLFLLVWIFESSLNIIEFLTRGWLLPKLTAKIALILFLVITIQFLPVLSSGPIIQRLLLSMPLLDKILAPSIAFLMILFNIPAYFYRQWLLWKAKKKIAEMKKLIVVGITGSYGKTSTKEYLAHILSAKFKVLKTEKSNNTDLGVAKTIINQLQPNHQVFVVEMGAYKKGEIAKTCSFVKPQIGIITGINQQHLELFGSIENTMKAKYELLGSLPPNGPAIINSNNNYCTIMAEWAKQDGRKVVQYGIDEDKEALKVRASNIEVTKEGVEFTIHFGNTALKARAPLFGAHQVENILAAAAASFILGVKPLDIVERLATLAPPEKTMKKVMHTGHSTFIDDSFNSNPKAVTAALNYMNLYSGKRVLVLDPLIELGVGAGKIHEQLGEQMGQVCDTVIVTNANYKAELTSGFEKKKRKGAMVKEAAGNTAIDIINRISGKDDIVIFEGKGAGTILKTLLSERKNYDATN